MKPSWTDEVTLASASAGSCQSCARSPSTALPANQTEAPPKTDNTSTGRILRCGCVAPLSLLGCIMGQRCILWRSPDATLKANTAQRSDSTLVGPLRYATSRPTAGSFIEELAPEPPDRHRERNRNPSSRAPLPSSSLSPSTACDRCPVIPSIAR